MILGRLDVVENPTPAKIAQLLGMDLDVTGDTVSDVLIVGRSSSGVAAAVYAGDDGTPTPPNTYYVTGQIEYDAWAKLDNEGFETKVRPLVERMTFLGNGDSVVSGVTAMAAFGHTPGHMAYHLESAGKRLVLVVDAANHYVWSVGYPDWEVKFDMDKKAAAATRRSLFGMLAADRVPFAGYHMPVPAVGYVAPRGEDGFEYIPTSYQFMP